MALHPREQPHAAAVSIALVNGIANICGVALPPLMGYIKDTMNAYDYALLCAKRSDFIWRR